jgi:hypothetical protein
MAGFLPCAQSNTTEHRNPNLVFGDQANRFIKCYDHPAFVPGYVILHRPSANFGRSCLAHRSNLDGTASERSREHFESKLRAIVLAEK